MSRQRAGGGQHFVEIAKVVEEVIPGIVGKDLKLNVSAAIPAVLLGVGFPVGALKGVPMLARTASLIAHLNEEMSDPIGFALSYQATREFEYTGGRLAGEAAQVIKVLDGVRVLEHGTFITGPAASMLLADLGADVVKVELPGTGDPFRAFKGGLYSPHYQTVNRNKRSVTLNTKQPADLEQFDALVKDADVYIQNFRPGFAEQIGAGFERLRGLNPRLIYCAISGFGATGPAAHRPTYDSVAQAASGFLRLLVNPANPRVVGPAIADFVTGFYAAYGILGALLRPRDAPASARKVELSMFEAMTHFNLDAFQHLFSANEVMGPFSRPERVAVLRAGVRDGKWIALHMSSPEKFWQGLAKAMERPDIFEDARFASRQGRIDHQEDLIAGAAARSSASHDRAEWCRRLEANDVPHSPMYTTAEVPEDAQAKHLQLFVETEHPVVGHLPHRALAGLLRRRAAAGGDRAAGAGRAQRGAVPRLETACRPRSRRPASEVAPYRPRHCWPPLALAAPFVAACAGLSRRPVRLVVPFGPGTTTDIVSRVFAEAMAKSLRPDRRGGKQGGRRRQHRRRPGGQVAGRRLHHRDGHGRHARDQPGAVPQDAVRRAEGLRADRLRRLHADAAGGGRELAVRAR